MRTRTWLGMMSGLCLASVTVRADAPAPVVGAPVALPTVDLQVDAADAGTAAVWEALQKGKMTPEEAWQKGLLDAQVVQVGLNQGLAGGEDPGSRQLRVLLGAVLVQHAPEVVKDTLKLTKQVQFALADYYASIGDERAAPLYEAVLKQTDRLREQGLVILQLGNFWTQQHQPQKAQDAYERGRKALAGKDPYFAGEMVLMAARAWAQNGDPEKARFLYARIPQGAGGWLIGMALWDQAGALIAKGDHDKARKLLLTPIIGQYADQIQVLLSSELAYSYYRVGEFKEARRYGQESIAQYRSLKNPLQNEGLEGQISVVDELLELTGRWEKLPVPIFVEPQELNMFVHSGDKPLVWQLAIRSHRPIMVTVTSDNSQVKIRPVTKQPTDAGVFFSNIVELEIPTENVKATLTVRSPQYPKWEIHVPITIEAQKNGTEQETIDVLKVD